MVKKNKGMSFLEIMLSFILLAIILTSIINIIPLTFQGLKNSEITGKSAFLCQRKIEKIRNGIDTDIPAGTKIEPISDSGLAYKIEKKTWSYNSSFYEYVVSVYKYLDGKIVGNAYATMAYALPITSEYTGFTFYSNSYTGRQGGALPGSSYTIAFRLKLSAPQKIEFSKWTITHSGIQFPGVNNLGCSFTTWQELRGREITGVFQGGTTTTVNLPSTIKYMYMPASASHLTPVPVASTVFYVYASTLFPFPNTVGQPTLYQTPFAYYPIILEDTQGQLWAGLLGAACDSRGDVFLKSFDDSQKEYFKPIDLNTGTTIK